MGKEVLVEHDTSLDHTTGFERFGPIRTLECFYGWAELCLWVCQRLFFQFICLSRVLFDQILQALRRFKFATITGFLLSLADDAHSLISVSSLWHLTTVRSGSDRPVIRLCVVGAPGIISLGHLAAVGCRSDWPVGRIATIRSIIINRAGPALIIILSLISTSSFSDPCEI